MGGIRSTYRVRTGEYGVLVGKPERNRQLGRSRRKWGENVKNGSSGSGMVGIDWIDLAQNKDRWRAFVTAVMSLRGP